ncbi:MAG: hypothetical protein HFH23_18070 [Ruminococcus sp.]|nr:hypothetical protein [Ruminococcus sp.]
MGYYIKNSEELNQFISVLSGGEKVTDGKSCLAEGETVELDGTKTYELTRCLSVNRPITIKGNGAVLVGDISEAISVSSGGVKVDGLTLDGFAKAVNVDALDTVAEHIELSHLTINDPGYGVCVNIASTENGGTIRDLYIHDCVMNSGYDRSATEEGRGGDGATGFIISAAGPAGTRQEDIVDTQVDGLIIERCRVLGGRRYGINMLAGVILPVEGMDYWSQKARVVNAAIRNVKVLDSEFDYCWEMGISLSCGCIMNYGSVLENLEVARCKVVHGIAGIGYSAAGPVVPTSIAKGMGVRHGSIHDNYVKEMDIPVNEPNFGITLWGGRAEGIGGVEVYDCFVEDVDIYNNTIEGSGNAVALVAANALSDEVLEISGNYLKNIRIRNNTIRDCETAFLFTAAFSEGRRFDWNWGWRVEDQYFAPLLENHHTQTGRFLGNYLEDISCTANNVTGCRLELQATSARGQGHAFMKDNKVIKQIVYKDNRFERSEGHRLVKDVNVWDWVQDDGGNEVDHSLLYCRF